jgi:hypothetical protein
MPVKSTYKNRQAESREKYFAQFDSAIHYNSENGFVPLQEENDKSGFIIAFICLFLIFFLAGFSALQEYARLLLPYMPQILTHVMTYIHQFIPF